MCLSNTNFIEAARLHGLVYELVRAVDNQEKDRSYPRPSGLNMEASAELRTAAKKYLAITSVDRDDSWLRAKSEFLAIVAALAPLSNLGVSRTR